MRSTSCDLYGSRFIYKPTSKAYNSQIAGFAKLDDNFGK